MLSSLKNHIRDPKQIILTLGNRGAFNWISDEFYIKLLYRIRMGKSLNLKEPETFSEKLQWIKLNDRKPIYSKLADKYDVREYIAEKIGAEYLIPIIGVWDSIDEINFEKMPEQFVLKCTHDSGGVIICNDRNSFDIKKAKEKFKKRMRQNYYDGGREWCYKNIKPRVIAEKYMGEEFDDYKIFVFNGNPDNVMVCTGRQTGNLQFYFFDLDWNLLRLNYWGLNAPSDFTLPKPEKWNEMLRISKELSKGTYFLRVDLYHKDNRVYFGELTFTPQSGFDANLLPETDVNFGKKIIIDNLCKTNEMRKVL